MATHADVFASGGPAPNSVRATIGVPEHAPSSAGWLLDPAPYADVAAAVEAIAEDRFKDGGTTGWERPASTGL